MGRWVSSSHSMAAHGQAHAGWQHAVRSVPLICSGSWWCPSLYARITQHAAGSQVVPPELRAIRRSLPSNSGPEGETPRRSRPRGPPGGSIALAVDDTGHLRSKWDERRLLRSHFPLCDDRRAQHLADHSLGVLHRVVWCYNAMKLVGWLF